MSIQGVAVIVDPSHHICREREFVTSVTDEDGSAEAAREHLMVTFAKTILGPNFVQIDRNDAWQLWQIAEKNGFSIRQYAKLPILPADE